mmetsp:Transcript_42433/g.133028  ORF Transcript_42433/g.133028 Transcript_42433/m.133028 type:complete len:240 (+) Transcript_42433:111-830(+)
MTASCTSVKPEAAGAAMSPSRASPTSPSPEPARDLPPVPSWFSSATRAECWLRVARWLHNKSAGAEWSFGSTTRVRAHLHLPHPLRLRGLEVLLQHLRIRVGVRISVRVGAGARSLGLRWFGFGLAPTSRSAVSRTLKSTSSSYCRRSRRISSKWSTPSAGRSAPSPAPAATASRTLSATAAGSCEPAAPSAPPSGAKVKCMSSFCFLMYLRCGSALKSCHFCVSASLFSCGFIDSSAS